MKHLIKQILRETVDERVINLMIKSLKSGSINPPYLKNLGDYGLTHEEIETVLSDFFGEKVFLVETKVTDKFGNLIYLEEPFTGIWWEYKYDKRNNLIFLKNSYGFWEKRKYDRKNNLIYSEDSLGYWEKNSYDKRGNLTYSEDSTGYWEKYEYDSYGEVIYFEDSEDGVIEDYRSDSL